MGSADIDVSAEVVRVAAALRTAIQLSEVSHRHIERSLYMSTGYLTRLLKGEIELRVHHVLSICQVIGLPAGNFFEALFPPSPPESVAQARLTRGLGALHPERAHAAHARDPETLLSELRSYLGRLRDLLEKDES
jgi:transcriptional regulator with XRE-family HTH domain